MTLVVVNLGVSLLLFVWAQRVAIPTEPDGTSGHAWAHGVLREGVRRLPLWGVVMSAAMFAGSIGYLALYPGFGSFGGMLGWTSRGEWQRDSAANDAKLDRALQPLAAALGDARVERAAAHVGRRLYLDNCAACHGAEAHGNQALGAPNLSDADVLYGGDADTVLASILGGRHGVMPAWGAALGPDGVVDVVAYVMSLSGTPAPSSWIEAGKTRFTTMCAACHGVDARGTPQLGAPNLRDKIWLYGGDFASISQSVRDGRGGVMPAWSGRLADDEARAIVAWLATHRAREPQGGR
jgi:cytochrome c oxidase cbb3-type subunit 3